MTTTDILSGLTAAQIRADAGLTQANIQQVTMVASNAGSVLNTGVVGYLYCQFGGTITDVYLFADQTGDIEVDIWKIAVGSFPPTITNTITASDIPTITAGVEYHDSTLTGWTTAVSAGDVFAFNIDSVTSIQQITCTLVIATS